MALLQLIETGIQCIADIKGASGTCQRLLLGNRHASGSIHLLDDLAEWRKRADHWPAMSRSLPQENLPLDRFEDALEVLPMELTPVID